MKGHRGTQSILCPRRTADSGKEKKNEKAADLPEAKATKVKDED